jgi:hypothetical protein
MCRDWFHFAVKIHFEGKSGSIKNRAAITAVTKVALDFASNFGREATFQIFADQTDRCLTRHAHCGPLSAEQQSNMHAMSQNM